jgi:hypothetical protein
MQPNQFQMNKVIRVFTGMGSGGSKRNTSMLIGSTFLMNVDRDWKRLHRIVSTCILVAPCARETLNGKSLPRVGLGQLATV